jgi:hypothetical protein
MREPRHIVRPADIDASYVPAPVAGLLEVPVGLELVIRCGDAQARLLNPIAALVWQSLDGESSVEAVAEDLSTATGAEPARVLEDVIGLTRQLAEMGLLEGVAPVAPEGASHGVAPEPVGVAVGDPLPRFRASDLQGREWTLEELLDHRLFLVNWSPSCGFCVRIAGDLAASQYGLERQGIRLALLSVGGTGHNRRVLDEAGLRALTLVKQESPNPFAGFGTPAAYLVEPDGTVGAPVAYGAVQVPLLAAELAGSEPPEERGKSGRDGPLARYLSVAVEACGAGGGAENRSIEWAGTRVYAFGAFHVGIRYNNAETAGLLDRLFEGLRVEDRRAPDNYWLALFSLAGGRRRQLNLLVADGQQLVRARSAARAVRALLAYLSSRLEPRDPSLLRLLATPAVRDGHGLILPLAVRSQFRDLEPSLARARIAVADTPWALVDAATAELVVPALDILHNQKVLAELDAQPMLGPELSAVRLGRYPIQACCLTSVGDRVGALSPVVAVALSLGVLHPEDAIFEAMNGEVNRTHSASATRLVELLDRVPAYGLRFRNAHELTDQILTAIS